MYSCSTRPKALLSHGHQDTPADVPTATITHPSVHEPWITMEDAAASDCSGASRVPKGWVRESPNLHQFSPLPSGDVLTSATCPGSGTGGPDTRPLWQAHTLCQPCPPQPPRSFSQTTLYWPGCPLQRHHLPMLESPHPRDWKAWRRHTETP